MKSIFKNMFWMVLVLFLYTQISYAQTDSVRAKISEIIKQAKGIVGVALIGLENHDTLTFNDDYTFPMQSVFKFPLALKVLSEVDKGRFTLDQKIHLKKRRFTSGYLEPAAGEISWTVT